MVGDGDTSSFEAQRRVLHSEQVGLQSRLDDVERTGHDRAAHCTKPSRDQPTALVSRAAAHGSSSLTRLLRSAAMTLRARSSSWMSLQPAVVVCRPCRASYCLCEMRCRNKYTGITPRGGGGWWAADGGAAESATGVHVPFFLHLGTVKEIRLDRRPLFESGSIVVDLYTLYIH